LDWGWWQVQLRRFNFQQTKHSQTFQGTFLSTIVNILDIFPPTLIGLALEDVLDGLDMDLEKRYCCPAKDLKNWKNCAWYGQPGSCFDNHCPIGHSVQLETSAYGLGESCFPRLERERVFCCDPANGESPFLPVDLSKLFPNPPTGDHVSTDFDLQSDNTWGDGQADTSSTLPNDSTFGFVVLTSPEELQVSLDKRDGSHWEVFNCNDAVSEEAQTVQMFCTDISENSNCYKISLGHGVPGTILEMPKGCGPSKYAVAKSMVLSADQKLPKHLEKRNYGHKPVVYDLTFDYDWRRVPRDLGDTQMRVDYSNEVASFLQNPAQSFDLTTWLTLLLLLSRVIGIASSTKRLRRRKSDLSRMLEVTIRDGLKKSGEMMPTSVGSATPSFMRAGLAAM
jgi:chitinase